MAANVSPIFTLTPIAACVAISTANTTRDGTGTIGTVWSAGADGGRLEYVRVQATGTTTAGVVRLFIHTGAAYFLWKELLVSAVTPSTTVEAFSAEYVPTAPLALPTGYSLRASTHNAEAFNIVAHAGNF
jgi:hypothetical protein